jgi:hypothetical protein
VVPLGAAPPADESPGTGIPPSANVILTSSFWHPSCGITIILMSLFWGQYSGLLILTPLFWYNHMFNVVLTPAFWPHHPSF